MEDAADVNGNGKIEAGDCMYLAKHLAGINGFEELK
ncbi:MAG: dockerin type I domain-containing protein [Methanosarcinales archaeon]